MPSPKQYQTHDDFAGKKTNLRNTHLALRDALDPVARIEMSLNASEHGQAAPQFDPSKFTPGTVVSGFNPIRSEIDPRPLMFELAKRGARLCLPVVINKTTIEFRELVRGAPMIETGFGTFGPDESADVLDPEVLLVPLSVFDDSGGRIGYGAGFYDRAIERLEKKNTQPQLLGMAFSAQKAQTVPMEKHDRRLHGLISETGFITF